MNEVKLIAILLLIIFFIAKRNNRNIPAKIKMSSLNYLNASKRIGFCYKTYYNDFNNEGHMYPVHGVGDIDKTKELMEKIINSVSGKIFSLTDLGINIKVSDYDYNIEI